MAEQDALELRVIDQGSSEYVTAPEGTSIEEVLERFVTRSAGFERDWVKVDDEGERYVRYDRIISVSIVRGEDRARHLQPLDPLL